MLHRLYPVIATDRVAETAAFWQQRLGFIESFAADWYVSLRHETSGAEIAFLDATHPTIPEGYRGATAAGILVNLEVDDVDAEWQRLVVDGGLEPRLAIRSEAFGQRHFIVADPAGVLVDVITEIPPTGEFVDAFAEGAAVAEG
ncbi:VOC family protein [Agrococcus jejuensis]|uniref:VOC family protein n=1 Tax=Agrococcus jejuensis TaxID=399736 RepID=UPI0011A15011|nr:VOC family protein [Agrococcus jejuensis]